MLSDPELGEAAGAPRERELAGALAGRDGEYLPAQEPAEQLSQCPPQPSLSHQTLTSGDRSTLKLCAQRTGGWRETAAAGQVPAGPEDWPQEQPRTGQDLASVRAARPARRQDEGLSPRTWQGLGERASRHTEVCPAG